jgi:tRNA A37 methylthiotransferase MiaB
MDLRESFVGRTMEVLTESGDANGCIQGQTKNGLPVFLPKTSLYPNQLLNVFLRENTSCGFIGTVLKDIS